MKTKSLLRSALKKPGPRLENAIGVLETFFGAKTKAIANAAIFGAVGLAALWGAGQGSSWPEAAPEDRLGGADWGVQEWVLAPESELDSFLTPVSRDSIDSPSGQANAKTPSAEDLTMTPRRRRVALLQAGLDQETFPSTLSEATPVWVLETRKEWDKGAPRREQARQAAKAAQDAPGLAGVAAGYLLAESQQPISLGFAGNLARSEDNDTAREDEKIIPGKDGGGTIWIGDKRGDIGTPEAAVFQAKQKARALGGVAVLPISKEALDLSLRQAAQVATLNIDRDATEEQRRIYAVANGDAPISEWAWYPIQEAQQNQRPERSEKENEDRQSASFLRQLFGQLINSMGFGAAAGGAMFLLLSCARDGAGEFWRWILGGARLARWGAWRPLGQWAFKAAATGLALAAFAALGAASSRIAGDAWACSRGGCVAFENALFAADPDARLEKADWRWAIEQGGAPVAIRNLFIEKDAMAQPVQNTKTTSKSAMSDVALKRAAGAEQERLALGPRGFFELLGAALFLGLGLAAKNHGRALTAQAAAWAKERLVSQNANAAARAIRPPRLAVGDPRWQELQIQLARARVEAREIAAAANVGREAANIGLAHEGSAGGDVAPRPRQTRRL